MGYKLILSKTLLRLHKIFYTPRVDPKHRGIKAVFRESQIADRGRLLTAVRDPRPAACEPRLDADGCPRPATRGLRTAACGTAASRLHSILYMFRSPLAKGLQQGHQGESPCCHGILHFRGHLGIFVPVDQPVPFQFL